MLIHSIPLLADSKASPDAHVHVVGFELDAFLSLLSITTTVMMLLLYDISDISLLNTF